MKIKIVVEKELDDSWLDDQLTDERIIDLIQEDVIDFLHGATWEVKRYK